MALQNLKKQWQRNIQHSTFSYFIENFTKKTNSLFLTTFTRNAWRTEGHYCLYFGKFKRISVQVFLIIKANKIFPVLWEVCMWYRSFTHDHSHDTTSTSNNKQSIYFPFSFTLKSLNKRKISDNFFIK
jgi:hypothetical protein